MNKEWKLLFSITAKDFDMQTFSVGGHGGSGKDTSNTGVRLVHRASGATGEGREYRSQMQNRKSALKRLVETDTFKNWHRIECAKRMGKLETPEEIWDRVNHMVDQGILDGTIKLEEFCGEESKR